MAEPNHSPRKGGNPVTAFFRGLYTEMAFSKESLRLNGQGLLFGLGVGLLVGVLGGLFDRLLAWADVLRNGTAWASLLLPLAGLVVVWMYRRGGIKTAGGTDLIIQAARGEQPVSRLLAPVVFCATVLTHAFGGSAGREGAALQMGGSLAELVRKGTGLGGEFQDLAIMCGMSAGFSAVFGSPITATLFALEISCVGILPLGALFPCVVSALTAGTVARGLGVHGMYFYLTASTPDALFYGRVVVLALACGLLSTLVCYTFSGVRAGLERLFPNPYLRVVAGSAVVMLLTALLGTKAYLGSGAAMIQQALEQGSAQPWDFWWKLLLTAITLGAGLMGGEIFPSFAIGACFGCVVGPLLGLRGGAPAGAARPLRRRHRHGVPVLRGDQLPPGGAGPGVGGLLLLQPPGVPHGGGGELSGLGVQWAGCQAEVCLFQVRQPGGAGPHRPAGGRAPPLKGRLFPFP